MKLDYNGSVPLFKQIADQLENEIFNETFKENEQVPSTTEISQLYQINPETVLKGMNLLVEQKILEKRRGIGMFVTSGALALIEAKRRNEFLAQHMERFVKEAKALHISYEELIVLIRGGYDR